VCLSPESQRPHIFLFQHLRYRSPGLEPIVVLTNGCDRAVLIYEVTQLGRASDTLEPKASACKGRRFFPLERKVILKWNRYYMFAGNYFVVY
jgi:hypothetical protein